MSWLALSLLVRLREVVKALGVSATAWADSVSGTIQNGYGRLSFSVRATTKVSATTTGGVLAIAGQKAEEMVEPRWADAAPLSVADRAHVLRAAVSYSLANYQAGLERI